MTKPPRSVYAGRLVEFPNLVLADESVFSRRGHWRDFFSSRIGPTFDGQLIFEIGCFDAAYLTRIAEKFPRIGFIGLDWKCKAIVDGATRIAKLGLQNVALLRGRGHDVLRIFGDGELNEIWLFHPDPCDRPAELRNRLMGEPFLIDVHHVLADDSIIALKTDHPGYYQWVLGLLGLPDPFADVGGQSAIKVRARDLMDPADIPRPSKPIIERFEVANTSADFWQDIHAQTHTSARCFSQQVTLFEARFIKKRQPIYYIEMRKKLS